MEVVNRVPPIVVSHVNHWYASELGSKQVLADVNLTVHAGQLLVIMGSNGSGKSTLISCIAGLQIPRSGSVSLTAVAPAAGGRSPSIALLHQDYRQTNYPWASAMDNITMPLRFRGVPRARRLEAGRLWLKELLPEVAARTQAHHLSGGQQQLLAMARALAAEPDILLADEPLSAMDRVRALHVLQLVDRTQQRRHCATIWISHDIDQALLVGDAIGLMSRSSKRLQHVLAVPGRRLRSLRDLTLPEFVRLRAEILDFLLHDWSNGTHASNTASRQ